MTKKFLFLVFTLISVMTSYSQVSKDTLKTVNLNDVEIIGVRPGVNTPISQKTITSLDISKDFHGQEMTYVLEKPLQLPHNQMVDNHKVIHILEFVVLIKLVLMLH